MKVADFDFDLPSDFIAQRPAAPRDSARLLSVDDTPGDFTMRDLPGLLRAGDLLVFNDTRVIPARLDGRRGQARIEATLIRQVAAVGTYMVTYSVGDAAERAAAGALMGRAPITGTVPVSLPGFFARGDGIKR